MTTSKPNKIKILHVIKSLGRGGAEMLLPETLKLHDQEKFEFHYIYFLPWKDQMVSTLETAGGKVTCMLASNNIKLMQQMGKVKAYIKKNNIQLVHAHLPWAGFLSRFIHKSTSIPVIYTEHNKQERYHKITFLLNKLTFNWQSAAVAVSKDVAESIQNNIKPNTPVKTILNGVNTDYFQRYSLSDLAISIQSLPLEVEDANSFRTGEKAEKKLPFDNGINVLKELLKLKQSNNELLVVGSIAVFRFQKRMLEWIKVFHEATQENENLRGVIVGNGPFAEQMLQLRDELELHNKLFIPGLQTNTKEWFSIMDVFMMSSEFEGLPIALLEAMSTGCAVVTTDAGGVKEVVRDGIDGLMVPVKEWEQLSVKLKALKDDTLKNKLAEAARQRVVDAFSLRRMVEELEMLYNQSIH